MLIGGSLGINGELFFKTSVPKEPPEGYSMLWFSDGNDSTFSNSDSYVSDNKLQSGLYIAYKPIGGSTIYSQITTLSTNQTWSNPYKNLTLDTTNVIHCTFKNTNNYGLPDISSFPYKLGGSGSTLLEGIHWVSGIGNLNLVGTNPIDFYELNIIKNHTELPYDSSNNYANTWQLTDKFLLSSGNISILNYTNDYLIPSSNSSSNGYTNITNSVVTNRPHKLQGSNYENAICVPNTGPQLSKISGFAYKEYSYLLSPYFINNTTSVSYWGGNSSQITVNQEDPWLLSSRIITFESFNNTDGYWPSTWYSSKVDASLYDKEMIKYRIITKTDLDGTGDYSSYINGSNYQLSYDNLKNIFDNKKWITLKGRQLNTNIPDKFYDDLEKDVQVRSYEIDKTNQKYAGSDGTDNDEGIGWITYEATIPKCVAFQMIVTYSTENVSFGPSNGHVSGWYLRNLKVYKKN